VKKSTSRKPVLAPQLSIGFDLGAEQSVACVLDRAGEVVERATIGMTPAEIDAAFRGRARATIVVEACTQSNWIARQIEGLGHEILVCNPRRLKLIASSTLKTDKLDAEILGRLARLSQLDPKLVQPITVRSRDTQIRRSHQALRDQLVASRTKLINCARGTLRGDALPVPRCDAAGFAKKLEKQQLPDDIRALLTPAIAAIAQLTEQIAVVDAKIKNDAKEMPVISKLTEIPGVGMQTAYGFVITIEDPSRFEHSRDIGPYLGLTPTVHQSSTIERRGHCTKQGDARMRRLLVQAALCLLRTKTDSELKQWALSLAERSGKKKAIVGLARKLGVLMHRLWVSGENYEPFPNSKTIGVAA